MTVKVQRRRMGISQSRLARLAGVSRFNICLHELGDKPLSQKELRRVHTALRAEARRLAGMASQISQQLATTI